MSEYVVITLETIAFLQRHNGGTTSIGDMIVYHMIVRFETEVRAYLTGRR